MTSGKHPWAHHCMPKQVLRRRVRKSGRQFKPRLCKDVECAKEFLPTGARQEFCEECATKRRYQKSGSTLQFAIYSMKNRV